METSKKLVVSIGEFRFDTETGDLTKGGQVVPLSPLATKALGFITTYKKGFIPREVLADHLWDAKRADIDAGLNSVILKIRKALNDPDGKIIQTVPRRGYRFTPPDQMSGGTIKRKLFWLALVGPTILFLVLFIFFPGNRDTSGVTNSINPGQSEATISETKILIKPAVDGSVDPDYPNFGKGFTDDLAVAIMGAKDKSLVVLSEETSVSSPSDYVLTSVYRAEEENIRITLQLIKTNTGNTVWAEDYAIRFDDRKTIPEKIVEGLVMALKGQIP